MSRNQEWTNEEIEFLKQNYLTKTYKEIGLLFNRSPKAICNKTRKLGFNKREDLAPKEGKTYANLKMIRTAYYKNHVRYCQFECLLCGKLKVICWQSVRMGLTTSCRCLQKKMAGERFFKHGEANHKGDTNLYQTWLNIKDRCFNRNNGSFADYGGRGITVEEPWKSNYLIFKEDALNSGYKKGLSIERKNNDGNYCKNNCIWADDITQANNRRNNHLLTAFGETKTLAQWSRDPRCQVKYHTLKCRINKYGWEAERAITTPTRHRENYQYSNSK